MQININIHKNTLIMDSLFLFHFGATKMLIRAWKTHLA